MPIMLLSAKTCVSYWLFHCNYQTLDTRLSLGWDPGKEKQTLHLPSKSGTSLSPMAIVKLHGKKYQYCFWVAISPLSIVWWNVALILSLQQEKNIDSDYCEDYLRSISKNIIMTVLRKANSHSVDIFRLIKNQ